MNNISKQEFLIGILSVVPLTFKLGIYTLLLCAVTGLLWVLGGTFNKLFRRLGVPISVLIFSSTQLLPTYWYSLIVPIGFGILSIGDGFPDNRPTTRDEGSFIGRFVEMFLSNEDGGGIITKLIIAVLVQLAWIPIYLA